MPCHRPLEESTKTVRYILFSINTLFTGAFFNRSVTTYKLLVCYSPALDANSGICHNAIDARVFAQTEH